MLHSTNNIAGLKRGDVVLLKKLQPSGWDNILPFYDFYTKSDFCFPIKAVISKEIALREVSLYHKSGNIFNVKCKTRNKKCKSADTVKKSSVFPNDYWFKARRSLSLLKFR